MVIAVGLDIVELDRIQNVWNNHRDMFLERHFHPDEPDALSVRRSFLRKRRLVPADAIEAVDGESGVIGLRVEREAIRKFL